MAKPPVNYRMLTPLIRIKINTKEKIHFKLTNNLTIIINDHTVFPNWNNTVLPNGQVMQTFSGLASMAFNYSPLLFLLQPYEKNYPDKATEILDVLLKGFALFKSAENIKFKLGPRFVQTLDATPLIGQVNIRGSDDFSEFNGKEYNLSLDELKEFKKFYKKYSENLEKISDKKFLESLEFFAKASRTPIVVEKYIFLSVAFEFLFSKESTELSYRFSNRASLLLGKDPDERIRLGKKLRNVIYEQRSKIVHGSSVNPPKEDVLHYFNEIMRVALLRFLSLYSENHNDPLTEIDSFLLLQDSSAYQEFRKDCEKGFGNISNLRFESTRTKI